MEIKCCCLCLMDTMMLTSTQRGPKFSHKRHLDFLALENLWPPKAHLGRLQLTGIITVQLAYFMYIADLQKYPTFKWLQIALNFSFQSKEEEKFGFLTSDIQQHTLEHWNPRCNQTRRNETCRSERKLEFRCRTLLADHVQLRLVEIWWIDLYFYRMRP